VTKRSRKAEATEIYFKSTNGNGYACFSNFWPFVKPNIAEATERRIAQVYTAATTEIAAAAAASASVAAASTATPLDFFTVDGVRYASVEHYYHSSKYTASHPSLALQIAAAPTALAAKQLNTKFRKTHPVDRAWFQHDNQVSVMHRACAAKFSQNPRLRALLVSTGDLPLHESRGRSKDIWGMQPDDPSCDQLGKILTKIRQNSKHASSNTSS
jgi:ribA/ribD-fused uncharacterized protein